MYLLVFKNWFSTNIKEQEGKCLIINKYHKLNIFSILYNCTLRICNYNPCMLVNSSAV